MVSCVLMVDPSPPLWAEQILRESSASRPYLSRRERTKIADVIASLRTQSSISEPYVVSSHSTVPKDENDPLALLDTFDGKSDASFSIERAKVKLKQIEEFFDVYHVTGGRLYVELSCLTPAQKGFLLSLFKTRLQVSFDIRKFPLTMECQVHDVFTIPTYDEFSFRMLQCFQEFDEKGQVDFLKMFELKQELKGYLGRSTGCDGPILFLELLHLRNIFFGSKDEQRLQDLEMLKRSLISRNMPCHCLQLCLAECLGEIALHLRDFSICFECTDLFRKLQACACSYVSGHVNFRFGLFLYQWQAIHHSLTMPFLQDIQNLFQKQDAPAKTVTAVRLSYYFLDVEPLFKKLSPMQQALE